MKSFILLAMICSLVLLACSSSDPVAPVNQATNQVPFFDPGTIIKSGRIVVYVHWNSQGIEGTKVEILTSGKTKVTGSDGIAIFRVPVGTFTVRVFNINRGGPAFQYIDYKIDVTAGHDAHIDVPVCLPCV